MSAADIVLDISSGVAPIVCPSPKAFRFADDIGSIGFPLAGFVHISDPLAETSLLCGTKKWVESINAVGD
jgi:hypothetical protein